jgi:hypothetical protein
MALKNGIKEKMLKKKKELLSPIKNRQKDEE